jgi:hypothetical protein
MAYIGKNPTSVPLTSSDITDGIISLPKLTDGTDGNLISYDASGNPVAVATGTDGQVLTSTGAGSPPVFEALPGGGVDTIFNVVKNVDQTSITDGTLTKITNWTADVDTGSGWDNTNHKFVIPAGKGGQYLIGATITQSQSGGGNSVADTYDIMIFKNGAVVFTNCDKNRPGLDWCTSHITAILDLAAADELEIYTKVTAGGGSTTVLEHSDYQASNRCTNWFGCKLA